MMWPFHVFGLECRWISSTNTAVKAGSEHAGCAAVHPPAGAGASAAGARTACVEYGPAPYQLTGDFRDLWLQNCAAKEHLEKSFAVWSWDTSASKAEWERECFGELP